ncbi:hypothetical protein O181_041148 [Austropuccinia psidii MF-1]|uniref:Uncharacterized protein n=1 Tax=Austropuccinia psidii MF-1 TaxID=1389203 RepID=A0A9Q3DIL8_9BASI|nr:hypothetical protein [Austropuccinia psidii MF-1]
MDLEKEYERPGSPSSKKKYLEDSRVSPHSPRSVPTPFDIDSEPELIQRNFQSVETLPRGRNINISVPVQKLVQRSQGGRMESLSKPLAGGLELLLTHQELSGLGEDHKSLRRMECIVLQRQGQKDK